jgi:hypothetical protein
LKIDLPWFNQGIIHNLAGCHLCLIDLGLRLKGRFSSLLAEAPSAAEENVGGGRFGEEEEHHDAYWR